MDHCDRIYYLYFCGIYSAPAFGRSCVENRAASGAVVNIVVIVIGDIVFVYIPLIIC